MRRRRSLMKINVPEKVTYIINILRENGYEAYAVGGCVRDSILQREPGDWDITTSASPLEVKELFHRTIDTGIQHGTVTVMLDKEGFEVTTYRLDGEYEDCRHPKQVEFTKSLEEDLKRRDFTINAMAYNEEDGMVDLFEGLLDIQRKRIRCVGNAMDRFEEDALRILRAVRFSAQIDFDIEQETKAAIVEKAPNLANISAERIREEFNKLFLSLHPEKLQIAYETGITKVVLPEFDEKKEKTFSYERHVQNCGDFILVALNRISRLGATQQLMFDLQEKEQISRWLTNKEKLCLSYAVLLQCLEETQQGKECEEAAENAKQVMRRLKFDNETTNSVTKLVKYSQYSIEEDDISLRRAMNLMGTDMMDLWFLLQKVNLESVNLSSANIHKVDLPSAYLHNENHPSGNLQIENQQSAVHNEKEERSLHLEALYQRYVTIMREKHCVCLKELNINGKDLIQLGCKPGVGLGILLDQLLQYVIEHPYDNNKETLLVRAKELL